MAADPANDVAAAIANAAFSEGLRGSWCRDCGEGIEVLPCQDPSCGNGLFARRSFQGGEVILEEDPVSGISMLLFSDEANFENYCGHCNLQLQGRAAMPVPCCRACGIVYCTEACREAAWWAHHEVLCAASNEAWAAFEAHARECSNEYYILAARALATLRHDQDDADRSSSDDVWSALPWAGYASRPWWETMRRPSYGGSSSSSGCISEDGDREGEKVETRSNDGSSEEALDSSGESSDSSLDRFFISKVREQTEENVTMLRAALAQGGLPQGGLANALLCSGAEGFGRLMGLLRVNALTVQAVESDASTETLGTESQTGNVVKGLAIYAVTSAMNHMTNANCYVASNPELPQHCLVYTSRRIELGEEICINYLEGAPFDAKQRHGILSGQYGIL